MLDLVFQGKEPMAKFISQMQLLALTTFKITLADNDDVQHLMRCGEMLHGITYLSLCGQCDDNINVHLLYNKMPTRFAAGGPILHFCVFGSIRHG
jgi:hypothetical protein